MSNQEIHLFPVTACNVRTVPADGLIIIQLSFLAHKMQKLEEADPGRNYVLTAKQGTDIRDAIDRALQQLKQGGGNPTPGPEEIH